MTLKKCDLAQVNWLVCLLVVVFAMASWVDSYGLWVELPILVQSLPEGWNLPSYLVIITQAANFAPLAYAIISSRFPRRRLEVPVSYFIICIGILACSLLAFFWDRTSELAGGRRSTALLGLTFALALVDCTSSLAFLAFMHNLKSHYLIAYFVGEGCSALIPALLAFIQGAGSMRCVPSFMNQHKSNRTIDSSIRPGLVPANVTKATSSIVQNDTIFLDMISTTPNAFSVTTETTDIESHFVLEYSEPKFSVQIFFFILTFICILSLASLALLNNWSYCKRHCAGTADRLHSGGAEDLTSLTITVVHRKNIKDQSYMHSDNIKGANCQMLLAMETDVLYLREKSDLTINDVWYKRKPNKQCTDTKGDLKTSDILYHTTEAKDDLATSDFLRQCKPNRQSTDTTDDLTTTDISAKEDLTTSDFLCQCKPNRHNSDTKGDLTTSYILCLCKPNRPSTDMKDDLTKSDISYHKTEAKDDLTAGDILCQCKPKRQTARAPKADLTSKAVKVSLGNPMPRSQYGLYLFLYAWLCALLFGFLPSIPSYSCLPYGINVFHLSVSLTSIANPVGCFANFIVKMKTVAMTLLMSLISTALAGYIIFTAGASPTPLLVGTKAGELAVVLCWVLFSLVVNFSRVSIATELHQEGKRALIFVGIATQAGALAGAILSFTLVNIYHVFQEANPCG